MKKIDHMSFIGRDYSVGTLFQNQSQDLLSFFAPISKISTSAIDVHIPSELNGEHDCNPTKQP